MDKPMTIGELFHTICGNLRQKGLMPDILDYALPESNGREIKNPDISIGSNLDYGGSEGIYLDIWIDMGQDRGQEHAGTFKTLYEDSKAMYAIAKLLADFIMEADRYINANLELFTWEGADVYPCNESGDKDGVKYSYSSMEQALEQKDRLLLCRPHVAVIDNRTKEKKLFHNEDLE